MAWTDVPDVEAKINAREKNVPWYNPSIDKKLGPSVRELLENYSKIPQAEVEDHVYKIVSFTKIFKKSVQVTRTNSVMRLGISSHIHASVVSDSSSCESFHSHSRETEAILRNFFSCHSFFLGPPARHSPLCKPSD